MRVGWTGRHRAACSGMDGTVVTSDSACTAVILSSFHRTQPAPLLVHRHPDATTVLPLVGPRAIPLVWTPLPRMRQQV